MKTLVTGSAGFIGGHVTCELAKRKHEVSGIDLIDGYPYEQCDARDFFRESNQHFDLVLHCAAVVGGRQLIETPLAHAANLEIDAALFQWAERTKPGRVVYVSSVAAYPVHLQQGEHPLTFKNGEPVLDCMVPAHILREENISSRWASPDELYGWAKMTGEYLASRSTIPVSIPRPFTVYGENQDSIFPFASIAQQVRERQDPVTVWGSGNQTRDFIHVDDVVNGMIAMAKQEVDGPVNFCTGRATSLNELIAMMTEAAGYSPEIKHLDKTEGLLHRVGDPKKLNEFYVPEITLEEGIRRGLQ